MQLLLETKVRSLWRSQAVVILQDSATLEDALKVRAAATTPLPAPARRRRGTVVVLLGLMLGAHA